MSWLWNAGINMSNANYLVSFILALWLCILDSECYVIVSHCWMILTFKRQTVQKVFGLLLKLSFLFICILNKIQSLNQSPQNTVWIFQWISWVYQPLVLQNNELLLLTHNFGSFTISGEVAEIHRWNRAVCTMLDWMLIFLLWKRLTKIYLMHKSTGFYI